MKNYHEFGNKVSRGTGAKRHKFRDKKRAHIGGFPAKTTIGERKIKIVRTRGGNTKVKVKRDLYVNVAIDDKVIKAKIINVIQGNNPDFTRQNIITKGAIVEAEGIGKVRITSRPGQDGVINGVKV